MFVSAILFLVQILSCVTILQDYCFNMLTCVLLFIILKPMAGHSSFWGLFCILV